MIRATHEGPVRILTVDRPPRNAIDVSVVLELGEAIAAAARDDACRALVLTGAPPAFSAGIDVKAVPTYDAATRGEMIRGINRALCALYGLPKPTVAAINGHALGGGLVAPGSDGARGSICRGVASRALPCTRDHLRTCRAYEV